MRARGLLQTLTAIVFAIVLQTLVPARYRWRSHFLSDEMEHVVAYFALGILAALIFRHRYSYARIAIFVVSFAGLLEYLQKFAPQRTAAIKDFMCSAAGGLAGIALTALALHLCATVLARRRGGETKTRTPEE